MDKIFNEYTVVELASVLAGPAVGQFFAELGARVIKIENKTTGGDVTRRWKLPDEKSASDISAYYASINWGKERLLLDLKQREDKDYAISLLKDADIVISNFKEASAQKLGFAYEQIRQINPAVVYAQLYAFARGIDRPAFDVVLQAEAGFLYMTGHPGEAPAKMPVALIDLLAAHQLKEGILLALLKKQQTGKGALVSTSLLGAAVSSLANQASNWLNTGFIPQPMGTAHPNIAPYGDIFNCKDDKKILVAAGTEKQFQQLCITLEAHSLPDDERFSENFKRVSNREALQACLAPFFMKYDRSEVAKKLLEAKVPYGAIKNMKEVFETPGAEEFILTQNYGGGTTLKSLKTIAFHID